VIEQINWYPGHMKKTRELIAENLKMVDAVIEVVDARIPMSSRNPIIDELVKRKRRIIVLNKSDLSDGRENERWAEHFQNSGAIVLLMNCMSGGGVQQLFKVLTKLREEKNEGQVRKKTLRMMIVGVPNVGKSSLINRMAGKKSAKTGDRPGVTRGKQWLNLENNMQLLDTPGILWPKFEDPEVGLNLAFCGSIKDEILDVASLALELISVLMQEYPQLLVERYKLEDLPKLRDLGDKDEEGNRAEGSPALATMDAIALKRGFILPGKKIDYERCGKTVLDEFRAGMIGRITLEKI